MAHVYPLDKKLDQFLRSFLEKENMTVKILSQKQLNIEDMMPHNSPVAVRSLLKY
jgi:hypothetical protein